MPHRHSCTWNFWKAVNLDGFKQLTSCWVGSVPDFEILETKCSRKPLLRSFTMQADVVVDRARKSLMKRMKSKSSCSDKIEEEGEVEEPDEESRDDSGWKQNGNRQDQEKVHPDSRPCRISLLPQVWKRKMLENAWKTCCVGKKLGQQESYESFCPKYRREHHTAAIGQDDSMCMCALC